MNRMLQVIMGAIIGFMAGISIFSYDGPVLTGMALAITYLIAATFLHIVVHETGHLVFGLLSGYRFVSFRVFSYQLSNTGNGFVLHRYRLTGTSGQCLMDPPGELGGDYPYRLYLLGGVIFNALFSLLALLAGIYMGGSGAAFFLRIFFFTGMFIAVTNLIPIREPVQNDGYNFFYLSEEDKRYIWVQFKFYAAQIRGIELLDMDESYFEYDAPVNSSFEATIALAAIRKAESRKDFAEVERISDDILEAAGYVMEMLRDMTRLSLLYKRMISDEDIETFYKDTERFRRTMPQYPLVLRCEYAYELLVNDDEKAAKGKMVLFERVMEEFPSRRTVEYERELMRIVDLKYQKLHDDEVSNPRN